MPRRPDWLVPGAYARLNGHAGLGEGWIVAVVAVYWERRDALIRTTQYTHHYFPIHWLSRSDKESFEVRQVLDVLEGD